MKKEILSGKKKKRAEKWECEAFIPLWEALSLPGASGRHKDDKRYYALPEEAIKRIEELNLPIWEWNAIDAATRIRFTAYSYSINATFGLFFITFVVLWPRKHNMRE